MTTKDTLEQMTSDCLNDFCQISFGPGTSTLIGWSPSYDKKGRITSNNPNRTTTPAWCNKCGRRWSITSANGQSEITATEGSA